MGRVGRLLLRVVTGGVNAITESSVSSAAISLRTVWWGGVIPVLSRTTRSSGAGMILGSLARDLFLGNSIDALDSVSPLLERGRQTGGLIIELDIFALDLAKAVTVGVEVAAAAAVYGLMVTGL